MTDETLATFMGPEAAGAVLRRLDTGTGVVIVTSAVPEERTSLMYALARALVERVGPRSGQGALHAAAVPVCILDAAEREPVAGALLYPVDPSAGDEALSAALRLAIRQDPYALVVPDLASPASAAALAGQADWHLILAGVDAARADVIESLEQGSGGSAIARLARAGDRWEFSER
ncbi:MAG: hypothetical protein KGI78_00500 [Patescibacteria group bacterium]|nr:hypothetical protein [Patescibacteria group bacterium]MDE1943978.1 hypothetical protein [Patescibacteria group bacterium]MDE1944693.1 hypothetical protein [Patescibacteria group bacterium]MDE2057318.1 hypothetical protein [Patescibacteria group bacterium]